VTWGVEGTGTNTPIGVTNFPDFSSGVVQLGAAAGSGGQVDPTGLIGAGITLGLGRISDSGISFASIITALQGDADTNIISTPSIITTDNEEATLNVGQEVPFVTGSFSNTGGSAGGAVNPFQTIQREQIGVKLTITPQINEGNAMLLKISQEISNIAQSAQAVDLITNQRIIETTVIVDDGEILVLGGLLEDVLRESEQRVPFLGRIPILGNLFRSRKTDKVKTNLLVFIRAKILRNSAQMSIETNAKYNSIQQILQGNQEAGVSLMPDQERPVLPPLEEYQQGHQSSEASEQQPSQDDE
jgi:general secretion pathway protein D